MHDVDLNISMNFSDVDPFVFNVSLFEMSKIQQSSQASAGFSHEALFLKEERKLGEKYQLVCPLATASKLYQFMSARETQGVHHQHDQCSMRSIAFADMMQNEAYCSDSSANSGESDEEEQLQAQQETMFSSTSLGSDRVLLANHHFFSGNDMSAEDQTSMSMTASKPRLVAVNFAQEARLLPYSFSISRSNSMGDGWEEDADWCEDSMAVELSSVDSIAVQDLRECEISFDRPHLDQFQSQPQPAASLQLQQQQQQSCSTIGSSSPAQQEVYGSSSVAPQGYQYSWWVEQRAAHAHSQAGIEYESDCSIATSLFVEVASVDEDGSYTGYGAACYEDDFEWKKDRARYQPGGVDSRLASYDSDESYATCYARWQSLQGNGYPSSSGEKSKHADASSWLRSKHKRKREDSISSSPKSLNTPNKRGALRAAISSRSAGEGNGDNLSCCYIARGNSPGSLISAEKNDGEDGYDGASEKGGRCEGADAYGPDDIAYSDNDMGQIEMEERGQGVAAGSGTNTPTLESRTIFLPPPSPWFSCRRGDDYSTQASSTAGISHQAIAPLRHASEGKHSRHPNRRRRADRTSEDGYPHFHQHVKQPQPAPFAVR
jgi:hypothetical protein